MIIVSCHHCSANIEVDRANYIALRKSHQFQCPNCSGFIPTNRLKSIGQPVLGIGRNLLILGSVAILLLGGIGFYLASRKTGDSTTSTQNIRNEILNNAYFQNLIATGMTSKQDLEAIEGIRPYQNGFIGISTAKVDWKKANAMALRTGAVVVEASFDHELNAWLTKTFALTPDSLAWVQSRGVVGILTNAGVIALKEANGQHKVLLHWRPSGEMTKPSENEAPKVIAEDFVLIPAGSFTMDRSGISSSKNGPPVNIEISEFYIAAHEMTWELWSEVRDWGLSNGYTDIATGGGKGINHPVHSLDWYDVMKWCNARSEKEELMPVYTVGGSVMRTGASIPNVNWNANGYRLPTSAEWEKAARGGLVGKNFPWGDSINHDLANYRANGSAYGYDTSPYATWTYHPLYNDGEKPYTSPVGSFAPNGYGLYDMAGNLWEWCWESPEVSYTEGANDPSKYPVLRGGCWSHDAIGCRTKFRRGQNHRFDIWHRSNRHLHNLCYYYGFRLARSSIR